MATVVQKSAFKPGKYKGKILSAEKLRRFVDGTNKAIAAGVAIPALKIHSPRSADDAALERHSATEGAGWLEKAEADADGAVSLYFKDTPDDVAAGVTAKTIKFTSPEFRENYVAPDGRYSGPIIRHVAFTPMPAAPDQGAMVLALDDVYQFSEDDFEGPAEEGKGDSDKGDKLPSEGAAKPKEENPDSPPKATDQSKMEAIRECFSELGLELTSDWTWEKDGAQDEILTGLKTLVKARQEAETDKSKEGEGDDEQDQVEQYPLAFSDDELAALPEKARAAIKAVADLKAKVQQFSDEKASTLKEQTIAGLKSSKSIPPGLKQKLLAKLEVLQFSDQGESATLTIGEVAMLLNEALPEQFGDGDTTAEEHPEGEAFFTGDPAKMTDEQATDFAHQIHSKDKTAKAA